MEYQQTIILSSVNLIRVLSDVVEAKNLYFLPDGRVFGTYSGQNFLANPQFGVFLDSKKIFGPLEFIAKLDSTLQNTLMRSYSRGLRDLPLNERRGTNEENTSFREVSYLDLAINPLTQAYLDFFKNRENYFFSEQEIEKRHFPAFPDKDINKHPKMKQVLSSLASIHLFTRLFGNDHIKPAMFLPTWFHLSGFSQERYTSSYCPMHRNDQKNAVLINKITHCFGCGWTFSQHSGAALGKHFDGDVRNLKDFLRPYYELNHPEQEGLPEKIEDLSTQDLFGLLIAQGTEFTEKPLVDISLTDP